MVGLPIRERWLVLDPLPSSHLAVRLVRLCAPTDVLLWLPSSQAGPCSMRTAHLVHLVEAAQESGADIHLGVDLRWKQSYIDQLVQKLPALCQATGALSLYLRTGGAARQRAGVLSRELAARWREQRGQVYDCDLGVLLTDHTGTLARFCADRLLLPATAPGVDPVWQIVRAHTMLPGVPVTQLWRRGPTKELERVLLAGVSSVAWPVSARESERALERVTSLPLGEGGELPARSVQLLLERVTGQRLRTDGRWDDDCVRVLERRRALLGVGGDGPLWTEADLRGLVA